MKEIWLGKGVTHANPPILGAGGKVFSVGAEMHAPDVPIATIFCFLIHKYAVVQFRRK